MPGNRNSGRRTKSDIERWAEKQEKWRGSIEVSKILKRFGDHSLGRIKMTATQIRAGEVLLSKALPNLQSVEFTGDVDHHHHGLTDSQLDEQIRRQARIAGLVAGETPQKRSNGADSVH